MRYISALFLMVISLSVWAESYVYLTNNTMEPLYLHTVQTGYTNISKGDQWDQLATEVPPLATVKFLRFNRDEGIKWGRTYFFDTLVQGSQSTAVLRQKLQGTWNFSKMWLSAEDDPWHYDRDIHRIDRSFDGEDSQLAFRSQYARVSGDDIYYVMDNKWQNAEYPKTSNHLKILTYNTWTVLPGLMSKNAGDRLDSIVDYVKGYDAVVFQEVFDPILTARFKDALKEEYPYITEIPYRFGRLLNGGSFIASRWPIEEEDTLVYDACRADGCFASKGINYAKINKGGVLYNLFGTHTHAYTGDEDIAVRMRQLEQFKAFKDSKNIPVDQPVIMAGDFNVDKIHYPSERLDMLSILNAGEPNAVGVYPYSYSGPVNTYAEDDLTEYLDYALYSNEHIQPYYSHNKLRVPRSTQEEHWGTWDLSDHYPVEGEFIFPLPAHGVN